MIGLMKEDEVAEWLNISVTTLRAWRCNSRKPTITDGPPYVKLGAAVRYSKPDVEEWLEGCVYTETPHRKDKVS